MGKGVGGAEGEGKRGVIYRGREELRERERGERIGKLRIINIYMHELEYQLICF